MTSYSLIRSRVSLDPFNGYYIFKKRFSKHVSITICNMRISHNGQCILIPVPNICVDRITSLREFAKSNRLVGGGAGRFLI